MTNYRNALEMPTLAQARNVKSLKTLNAKQKKAVQNIRACADYQWMYVNDWYDNESEESKQFLLSPEKVFETVYKDSLQDVYFEGGMEFGTAAEKYLKDVRFCGKEFLQTVALYYTAKLLEEAVEEVEATEEQAQKVAEELKKIRATL